MQRLEAGCRWKYVQTTQTCVRNIVPARPSRDGRLACSCNKDKTTSGRKKQSGKQKQNDKPSKLDLFVRNQPVLSRFYDGTLILGDCVMILATQFSSERITPEDAIVYAGVLAASWVLTGAWLGDYAPAASSSEGSYLDLFGSPFKSIVNSTLTWAFSTTASLAVLSALVAKNVSWINALPLVQDLNSENTSPELEVIVAMLITMLCWRGIASRLRL